MTVQFDLDMEQHAPLPCASYTATPLGSPAASLACVWRNARQLSVPLGYGLASPQVALSLAAGIAAGLLRSTTGTAPTVALLPPAQLPQLPVAPVVQIAGPQLVANCATQFKLSAVASAGLSLFAAPVFSWTATPATPALTAAIAVAAGGPTLTVSLVDLVVGTSYVVSASVAGGASASHTLQLSASPQRVAVAILAPSALAIHSWSEVILVSEVSPCGGAAPSGTYSFAWTKLTGPDVALDRATQVTNTYRIAPNTLVPGVYVFQVSVDLDDNLATVGRATATVTVLPSPLVALPTGQQADTRLRDVRLDGGESEDPDNRTAAAAYAWQCHEVAFPGSPCVVSSLAAAPAVTATGLLQFPAANLAPGPWSFTLVVSRGTERARAFDTVVVDWNEAPSGKLRLLDSSRLQQPGFGSPARAANIVNARQPLVLYASHVQVAPRARIATWQWAAPRSPLNLTAVAQGTTDAFLFLPPGSLTSGAGYEVAATAVDTAGRNSTLSFAFTVNDEPRAVLPGGGCALVGPVPAVVQAVTTVLRVQCQGWTDDSGDYPLGYLFRTSANFMLSSGFVAGSAAAFVLPSSADNVVTVRVSDAMGAWSSAFTVPFPPGTTFAPAIPQTGDAAAIAAAAATLVTGALNDAVRLGEVERIDQVAQGIMLGLTQPLQAGTTAAQLQQLRDLWRGVADVCDKYVVQQPTLLWCQQQGAKLAAWTRSAQLLDPALQNVSLATAQADFALAPPGTADTGTAWLPAFNNWVRAFAAQPSVANVSDHVSARFVGAAHQFLGAQVAGGAAVPQSTVTAAYRAAHVSLFARLDTFGQAFGAAEPQSVPLTQPLPLTLAVPLAGRQHSVALSLAAAAQIEAQSPLYHGLQAWATDTDIFQWASQPPLALASDVVSVLASAPASNAELIVGASVVVRLQLTPALAVQPGSDPNATALACARWDAALQLWSAQDCAVAGVSSAATGVVDCDCNTTGIFAAVWAPVLSDGAWQAPLLPLGPAPGFGVPWLPIAAVLILLFLMGLLVLLYCCLRRRAPARSAPLAAAAGAGLQARPELSELDEWSAHLRRPARVHRPGAMPPDTHVAYYEATSSGEDDWPPEAAPPPAALEAPLLPRAERAPFVGGRVALVRDVGRPFEGEGAIVAPPGNAFDRFAAPYGEDLRRYDRQLGAHDRSSEDYASADKKLK